MARYYLIPQKPIKDAFTDRLLGKLYLGVTVAILGEEKNQYRLTYKIAIPPSTFLQTKKPDNLDDCNEVMFGNPAFHLIGSATFRPYLTIGLARMWMLYTI